MSDKAPVDPTLLSDDEVLGFTQKIRRHRVAALVGKFEKADAATEIDKSDKTMLVQLLDGMDRQALTNKRIKVEEESNTNMAGHAAIIAELLSKLPNRVVREDDVIENAVTPMLPDDFAPPVLVPGETDVAASQLSYDTFVTNTPNR